MDEQTAPPSPSEPPLPPSPLPNVGGPVAPASAPALNPWQTLNTVFTLDAGTQRPVRRPKGVAVIARSNFRRGDLRVEESGLLLSGKGMQPLPILQIISLVGWLLIIFGNKIAHAVLRQSALSGRQYLAIYTGLFLLSLGMYWGARVFNEWRRVPMQFLVPWGAVKELQIEPKLRWANLLYYGMPPTPRAKPPVYFVPINNLPPAMIAALADAVGHHAPAAVQHDVRALDWMWINRLISWAFVLILLGFLIPVLWQLLRH